MKALGQTRKPCGRQVAHGRCEEEEVPLLLRGEAPDGRPEVSDELWRGVRTAMVGRVLLPVVD
jgi:hypothetical protein